MAVRLRAIAIAAIAGVVAAVTSTLAAQAPNRPTPVYKDPRLPVGTRVEDLLRRMTLEEKVAQLETVWETKAKLQTARGDFSPDLASRNFPNGIGGFARPSDYRGVAAPNGAAGAAGVTVNRDARQTAEFGNAAQHLAVER